MESNYEELESTNSSSEEADRTDNELGMGRSYECVFCKRGFNTAQALGGHMNIHRKDRTKNKPNSAKLQPQSDSNPARLYQQIDIPPPPSPINYDHHQIFGYFPASTSTNNVGENYDYYYHHHHHQFLSVDPSDRAHQQPSNPLVSAGGWPSFMEGLNKTGRTAPHEELIHKEELDLELRLGYDS